MFSQPVVYIFKCPKMATDLMFLRIIISCSFGFSQLPIANAIGSWGYSHSSGESPANWSSTFPACGRLNQSPVNFELAKIEIDPNLEAISFMHYDDVPANQTWKIINNGHTAQLQANFTELPQLQRGSLTATYDLLQIHFHWGKDDFEGSEHHIDGWQHPLEMHIVHKRREDLNRTDLPENLKAAVIGVFFRLHREPNPVLQPFIDALKHVEEADDSVTLELPSFSLNSLLPQRRDYFRYNGSLTTPPCDAIVQWSVLTEPVPISPDQLRQFRTLKAHSHHDNRGNTTDEKATNATADERIIRNFRPIQNLGDRKVVQYMARSTRAELPSASGAESPTLPTAPARGIVTYRPRSGSVKTVSSLESQNLILFAVLYLITAVMLT